MNEKYLDQITQYLKKKDLEWLGFNWFKLRVGLLILEDQRKTTKLEIFLEMIIRKFEIFPSLKEIKESLLKAFGQHLKKNMIKPDKMESLNAKEK